MKQPLIVLTGPTAVGKTELSIQLAKAVQGEIISADSMQVYRYMDIGSAKIRPDEMQGIPHHLIDCYEPEEDFHVAEFQRAAKAAMKGIYERGKIPIITGGTGFYIQALVRDIDFTQAGDDPDYQRKLETLALEKGAGYLHKMLQEADPAAAEEIHVHNSKRIIRALEYYHITGEPISIHNTRERARVSPYQCACFVLNRDRQELYERIDFRVDQMLAQGLLDEVKGLLAKGYTRSMVSMQGLGYKELLDYLNGKISYEEAVCRIKRDTRHFAKRQITWFKREPDVIWLNREDFTDQEALLAFILNQLQKRGIYPYE